MSSSSAPGPPAPPRPAALARGGARVAVLDRATFPRNKPCGGGLTSRGRRAVSDSRGPRCRASPRTPSGGSTSRARAASRSPSRRIEPAVMMVRRVEFDALLVSLAREAGAELVEGVDIMRASTRATRVRLEARDGRVVRGADRHRRRRRLQRRRAAARPESRLAARPGRARHDGGDAARGACARRTTGTLWVSFAPGGGHGYGYIFPKRDHVNVGIGYVLSSFQISDRAAALRTVHAALRRPRSGCAGLLDGDLGPGPVHALSDSRRRPAAA